MVKNREELLKVASSNANQLKSHIRHALVEFMKAHNTNAAELSHVLGINGAEMNDLLRGNGSISVDTLSKLLVATDMAVELKPVSQTPLKGYGTKMPRSGGFKRPANGGMPIGIPVDRNGRPMMPPPPMPPSMQGGFPLGFEPPMPPEDEEMPADFATDEPEEHVDMPMRDSHGRFVSRRAKKPTPKPASKPSNPYMGLPDNELANIIRCNIWDGEIDIYNASHEELASFVAEKERIMRERKADAENDEREAAAPKTEVHGGTNKLTQFIEMLGNMAQEAKNNPELAETIARFMPK